MNVKLDFVLREIAGETLLVPAGKTALDLNGMLTLNETGAALWRMLPEAADAEALTQGLLQEFEGAPQSRSARMSRNFLPGCVSSALWSKCAKLSGNIPILYNFLNFPCKTRRN